MNRIIISVIAAGSVFAAYAGTAVKAGASAKTGTGHTKEEQALLVEKHTGGRLYRHDPKSGRCVILDTRKDVKGDLVGKMAHLLNMRLRVDVAHVAAPGEKVSLSGLPDLLKKHSAKGIVALVEDPSLPRLLVANEEHVALVNTLGLDADKPMDIVLERRIRLEILRAFGYCFGAAETPFPGCVLKGCSTVSDLDMTKGESFAGDVDNRIREHLKGLGVLPWRLYTYKRACMEGWAPAPTNEFQKAIWDDVHRLPTKPIRIEPEKKKVAE